MRQSLDNSGHRTRSWTTLALLSAMLLVSTLVSGCASVFMDQEAVPNTKQRLVVGHNNWPSTRVWVIDGDKLEGVKVRRAVQPWEAYEQLWVLFFWLRFLFWEVACPVTRLSSVKNRPASMLLLAGKLGLSLAQKASFGFVTTILKRRCFM